MRLSTVLTPESDENLTLAKQCGVEDVVTRYRDLQELEQAITHIESFDMSVSVIEGHLPIENIKLGNDQCAADIEQLSQLIRYMGERKIPILCYNFMAGTDWVRTSTNVTERGGALVTAFELSKVLDAVSLTDIKQHLDYSEISADQLWENLEYFLKKIVPVAEANGVILAMHPDDPPLDELLGRARIMNCVESFDRMLSIVPSPNNAICFCQGTFATMGVDIPATIRHFGERIQYVHFRDVRGRPESFQETFHDNGPTDMTAAILAYRDIGFTGPIRPDHVPQLIGEEDGVPGYTMLGRLFAYGYMRGLMEQSYRKHPKI